MEEKLFQGSIWFHGNQTATELSALMTPHGRDPFGAPHLRLHASPHAPHPPLHSWFGARARALQVAGRAEPYFPQPEDDQNPACAGEAEPMEPVGPWAQGKPDWGPLSGMTGTRPAVDRYSITRYSVPEWRKHNLDTFQRAAGDNHNAGMVDFNSRACMQHVAAEADKNQADSTGRLEQRAMDVHRWLAEVRKAHKALWDELQLLEAYRARLRRLLCTLTKCANVAGQCLDLRNRRNEPDLVRDEPEEELVKEVALIKEVSELMKRCLIQVEDQLRASRAAKGRLSGNWSDKKQAYDVDTYSGGLRSGAPTATFHEGATRFADSQSTPESWEAASREDICLAENERAKSAMLRNLIDAMVHDSGRDLRQQEARVDEAVQRRAQSDLSLDMDLELFSNENFHADSPESSSDVSEALLFAPVWGGCGVTGDPLSDLGLGVEEAQLDSVVELTTTWIGSSAADRLDPSLGPG
ncbi:hypothetical protein FOCC_FOCC002873, partial [Frankliniella occidentalis]